MSQQTLDIAPLSNIQDGLDASVEQDMQFNRTNVPRQLLPSSSRGITYGTVTSSLAVEGLRPGPTLDRRGRSVEGVDGRPWTKRVRRGWTG